MATADTCYDSSSTHLSYCWYPITSFSSVNYLHLELELTFKYLSGAATQICATELHPVSSFPQSSQSPFPSSFSSQKSYPSFLVLDLPLSCWGVGGCHTGASQYILTHPQTVDCSKSWDKMKIVIFPVFQIIVKKSIESWAHMWNETAVLSIIHHSSQAFAWLCYYSWEPSIKSAFINTLFSC